MFYLGEFVDSLAEGYGVMSHLNGGLSEGEWSNDLMNGVCIESWVTLKQIYLGEFRQGLKNGIGAYHWEDGSKFEGEFFNGAIQGWVSFLILGEIYYV